MRGTHSVYACVCPLAQRCSALARALPPSLLAAAALAQAALARALPPSLLAAAALAQAALAQALPPSLLAVACHHAAATAAAATAPAAALQPPRLGSCAHLVPLEGRVALPCSPHGVDIPQLSPHSRRYSALLAYSTDSQHLCARQTHIWRAHSLHDTTLPALALPAAASAAAAAAGAVAVLHIGGACDVQRGLQPARDLLKLLNDVLKLRPHLRVHVCVCLCRHECMHVRACMCVLVRA